MFFVEPEHFRTELPVKLVARLSHKIFKDKSDDDLFNESGIINIIIGNRF
jgi:hypothetical protein